MDPVAHRLSLPLDTAEGRLTAYFYLGALRRSSAPDHALVEVLAEALRASGKRA